MVSPDLDKLSPDELHGAWPALSDEERLQGFMLLSSAEAEEFVSHINARDAEELISRLPEDARRHWLRLLPPDDVADIIQEAEEEHQEGMLELLDEPARQEAAELLEYDEDDAGGLMTPRFARLRPNMTASQAIEHLRRQASEDAELIYYGYVVDEDERLAGVVSFRELVISPSDKKLSEIMTTDITTLPEDMDQEEVSRIFAREDLYCLPTVDEQGRIKGIITADDIIDVVEEEATEDMHKLSGTEALDAPYLHAGFIEVLRKRGVWLVVLLLLGFLTVEVMGRFQRRLAGDLAVLALFVPLIISCGGNTGSQASTLVVRAMALGEVRLRDWFRVIRHEIAMGLGLGLLLGLTGLIATLLWNMIATGDGTPRLGRYPVDAALAIASSVLCVVLWGTLVGSMLPFILRRCGADPAGSSAPLIATIVDSSGLLIYFTVGGLVLNALSP